MNPQLLGRRSIGVLVDIDGSVNASSTMLSLSGPLQSLIRPYIARFIRLSSTS
jgi:hypothetical protein